MTNTSQAGKNSTKTKMDKTTAGSGKAMTAAKTAAEKSSAAGEALASSSLAHHLADAKRAVGQTASGVVGDVKSATHTGAEIAAVKWSVAARAMKRIPRPALWATAAGVTAAGAGVITKIVHDRRVAARKPWWKRRPW